MHGVHPHIYSHKYNIKSLGAYVHNMYDDSGVITECISKNYTHDSPFAVYCGDLVSVGLSILSGINSLALSASEANLHLVSVKQT